MLFFLGLQRQSRARLNRLASSDDGSGVREALIHINAGGAIRSHISRHMQDAIGHFPARLLTPDEQTLVAEWLAVAGDIAQAFVSNRRGDDPAHHRRIVIVTKPDEGPSHLVHASRTGGRWVVFTCGPPSRVHVFPTLRAALNAVRPVLPDTGAEVDSRKPAM